MAILCIVESKTGNTSTFLDFLLKYANDDIHIYQKGYHTQDIPFHEYEKIIIGTYTWGYGKIPTKLKKFIVENHKELKGKKIFVYGSGNTVYRNFCGAVDSLKIICEDSGCKSFSSVKFEQRFRPEYIDSVDLIEIIKKLKKFFEG